MSAPTRTPGPTDDDDSLRPACVLVFNANDASGAAGLACDVNAVASVGAHALAVVTGRTPKIESDPFDTTTIISAGAAAGRQINAGYCHLTLPQNAACPVRGSRGSAR